MSELLNKQKRFTELLPKLILKVHELGLSCTIGDAYRDPRAFGPLGVGKVYGNARSAHKMRLAIDLNLFDGDEMLTKTEDHRRLGEYWESLDPLCRWGGRFNDGNHYSLEHMGVK